MTRQLDSILINGEQCCPQCKTPISKCPIGPAGPQCECKYNWSTGRFSKITKDGKRQYYCYLAG